MAFTAEEKGKGRESPRWMSDTVRLRQELQKHKTVVSATSASLVSTFLGYPLDSIKSRLQAARGASPSIFRLTAEVWTQEGIRGFWRGALIPLPSTSVVRTTSFSIYTGTKKKLKEKDVLASGSLSHIAGTSFIAGCASGSLITTCSCPFELVKVRRQLEMMIAHDLGVQDPKPLKTWASVKEIVAGRVGMASKVGALYTGFAAHSIRDTLGTGLYFGEYDCMRQLLGRLPSGEQGPPPSWLPIHPSLIPFVCGSAAGVSSWALIYPIDAVKTNIQKGVLSGYKKQSIATTFMVIAKGRDPLRPLPMRVGLMRLYRGLGVSAMRSCLTHGLLWLLIDNVSNWIDRNALPLSPTSSALA